MKQPLYVVDAFTRDLFSGNPAAVVPLEHWLPAERMQQIAAENNLSETAYFVPVEHGFELRWFTPKAEVDLCGHATLAAAHVLFHHLNFQGSFILFQSRSGPLNVYRGQDWLTLDFPVDEPVEIQDGLVRECLIGSAPVGTLKGKFDFMAVLPSKEAVENVQPDFGKINGLDGRGLVVTARGDDTDFVSRFFAPKAGVPEDPVTGSTHCLLAPYWSKRLQKKELTAWQLSARGGFLRVEWKGARVLIGGQAVTYLEGAIQIPEHT